MSKCREGGDTCIRQKVQIEKLQAYIARLYNSEVEELIDPDIWDDCPFTLDETKTVSKGLLHER